MAELAAEPVSVAREATRLARAELATGQPPTPAMTASAVEAFAGSRPCVAESVAVARAATGLARAEPGAAPPTAPGIALPRWCLQLGADGGGLAPRQPVLGPTGQVGRGPALQPRVGELRARIRIGTLQFDSCGAGMPTIFETAYVRLLLRHVESCRDGMLLEPGRWREDLPMTARQTMKFGRSVSDDGQYSTRVACEFDEELDLPPVRQPGGPACLLVVEIWLERRTMLERLDSLLERVGFGAGLPEFDRTWLGRVVVDLPPKGTDRALAAWPVAVLAQRLPGAAATGAEDAPRPHSLTLGLEWVVVVDGDDP